MTVSAQENSPGEPTGIIGTIEVDGVPVVYKFVNELPSQPVRAALRWLTVISWEYDGSATNGMPPVEANALMLKLEDAIEADVVKSGFTQHAYSRTGNGLKELVYYIRDRDEFTSAFNAALSGHDRYPIDLVFYEDPEWEDLKRVLEDFSEAND